MARLYIQIQFKAAQICWNDYKYEITLGVYKTFRVSLLITL
jgi:hypothetical protein